MASISIIYYSMYGHVKTMADAVAKGVTKAGCTPKLFQVRETLPRDENGYWYARRPMAVRHMPTALARCPIPFTAVLERMGASDLTHNHGIPIVDAFEQSFTQADGYMFGMPTRFGMMPAQMKAFFDTTGGHWAKGSLIGKPAGTFFSTATQNGGQETTALTAVTQFTHHGMLYVPAGYIHGELQFDNAHAHGGSPYGPGTLANGDGSRQPSKGELAFAEAYGQHFAKVANALKRGRME